jgi:Cof subfamily protein (haloacid dehalogenase superfamily)
MTLALPDGVRPGGRFDDWGHTVPRYVVADVDGTLVGPQPHASEEVVAAVAHAQQNGVDVGFATGRMRLAVEPLWEQLRAHGPHVLHNGAEVRMGGRTAAAWPLSREMLEAVFGIVRDLDAYVEVYLPDGYLVSELDERAMPHWELLGRDPAGVVAAAADLDGREVLKVTFAVFDGAPATPIVEALSEAGLRAGPAGSPLTPTMTYVNGTHPDASKGTALTRAAELHGTPLAAVACIGDAHNDLPMLAVAGTAIAMGQAEPDVIDAAHLVVPEVSEHGVALALRTIVDWHG